MRRSLLASLVLLHFLIFSEVQGIRLGKGISVFGVKTIHEEEGSKTGNTVGNGDGTVACKNGECTGIYRGLVTTNTMSTTVSYSISKNAKNSMENFVVHPSPVVNSRPDDMLDIAEMDYSPVILPHTQLVGKRRVKEDIRGYLDFRNRYIYKKVKINICSNALVFLGSNIMQMYINYMTSAMHFPED